MMNSIYQNKKSRKRFYRSPNFESGILQEPSLLFGGHHEHIDPKTGLALYGPYTVAQQERPTLSTIILGLIGTGATIANTQQWLESCKNIITNDGSQPLLYPHFPGFNSKLPFQCEIILGDTWNHIIPNKQLKEAITPENIYDRIRKVVDLYVSSIETLSLREPQPSVILCCFPQEVVDLCTFKTTKGGEVKRIKKSPQERKAEKYVKSGQMFLWTEMNPTLGVEDIEWGHENLRRGLKAEAMHFGFPTQIIWPRTVELSMSPNATLQRQVQDAATRAWNFMTGIYHKAGGSLWRLANIDHNTCFVGVSFYKELKENNPRMRTSMAQAFTAAGDGYVLRGNTFEWDETRHGKTPHLDQRSSSSLMQGVLELYQRQNQGALSNRVVVHKTSRFWEEEIAGFSDSCENVHRTDFVTLNQRGIQFYRSGEYPPLRGSYVKFSETDFILYTVGYIPFLRTYPGARVPQPVEILEHHGDSPWNLILKEILSLTKMNWNTADFACSEPITLAFSKRVGQILAELPPELPLKNEYRFYM